ncbi:sigma-54 dependent transcriptional regulator [Cognatishimia sp. MH4019]|uniref:sigma-54-dependent transcriptional regulator n=1 Tax=Cognatishimia sp. MH4019 TaxID=2854030 RepID=UPI001CD23D10|nr:helix-turn-helix domain-containing protein [Cognatishimia sp. MH4019]
MTTPILLIEGTASLRMVYRSILERAGNTVTCATSRAEGLSCYHTAPPCVVILDGMLEGADHEAVLRHLHSAHPGTKVLMTLPQTMLRHRPDQVKQGVFDILVKPFNDIRLLAAVADARTEILRARLAKSSESHHRLPLSLIGSSPAITKLRERLDAFAQSTAPVMVTGAEGTGKSDCAQHLHAQRSTATRGALHDVICRTATPESLSALLAQMKPTESLLLHEVDRLPVATAQYFLDRIKTGPLPVHAIISTLEGSVMGALERTAYPVDLIHRLNALPLNLPTLAQRQTDLCQIADAALPELCAVENRGPMSLTPEAATELLRHNWPGNIPELINLLRQIVVLQSGPQITAQMIRDLRETTQPSSEAEAPVLMGQTLADIERMVIEQTIRQYDGSVPKAAKSLGVSPSTLYRKRETWDADA